MKGFASGKEVHIKKDYLLKGFTLILSDAAFKILGFKIFYEFPGDPFGSDIILGSSVTPQNVAFLPTIKGLGDGYFKIQCIAIEKNGKKFNANEFIIHLDD